MRLPALRQYSGMSVNMTPMIDVVFQLIVFFTATSTIVKTELSQTVELPVAEKGQDRDERSRPRKITANVAADGAVSISGNTLDAAAFAQILRAELTDRPAGEIEVQFRADRAAPYRSIEPLLLICARSGIRQVSFSVNPKPQRSD